MPKTTSAPTRLLIEDGAAAAIVSGTHGDPFAELGPHVRPVGKDGAVALMIATFQPSASAVRVIDPAKPGKSWPLRREHGDGLFAGVITGRRTPFPYQLEVERHGITRTLDDPYRFGTSIDARSLLRFRQGQAWRAWDLFGAHPASFDGVDGYRFAVWAPHAQRVSVVGPFNGWDGRVHVMRKLHEAGIWDLFIPGLGPDEVYKYEVRTADGHLPLKADPYAFKGEHRPRTASVTVPPPAKVAIDDGWVENRAANHAVSAPVSIYELHFGSWRRVPEEGGRPLTYLEMADWLIPYMREMGFTHVQFMPLTEYPFDGSWGYQPTGLFAATSRYGSPDEFRELVARLHLAGIGVLCDFVPAHFPADGHGLARFDGTALYEHEDSRLGWHPDWKSFIYNFQRPEVVNFLIASALYWLDRFKLDGLRVDAVSSMLYLDYSRGPGEWVPNIYGGNIYLEAVEFLRRMNEMAYGENPGIMMVAEESTAWDGVSRPTSNGGLGFGYKWNMGWMHDTLQYFSRDPIHRRYHHAEISFGLVYGFSENFILALSHDEVVHGKGSLWAKMAGDEWQKFANLRAMYALQWAHPGKKLLFMGGEFAQRGEWNHDGSLDWHLLDDPAHRGVQTLVKDLNRLYRDLPALHVQDCDPAGFQWLQVDAADVSVYAFVRQAEGHVPVVAIFNLTPVPRHDYVVGVPWAGRWKVILNSDASIYGGSGMEVGFTVEARDEPRDGQPHAITLSLPPLAGIWLMPG